MVIGTSLSRVFPLGSRINERGHIEVGGCDTIELARDAYGVVFSDERTLEIDAAATEALRGELRGSRKESSLTDYFGGVLPRTSTPVSVAGNTSFGMTST